MADTALTTLEPAEGAAGEAYISWEDLYRQRWQWDKVVWGTHCVDCYPGNCPYRVYVKDGIVLHEEQAATYNVIEEGVPDMNPMGCQKGAESIIHEITGPQGGPMALTSCLRFVGKLGGLSMDLDGVVGDLAMGLYEVFGKIFASTVDDWFHSDLIIIRHSQHH